MIVIFVFNPLLKISSIIVSCDFTIQNVFKKIHIKKTQFIISCNNYIWNIYNIYKITTERPKSSYMKKKIPFKPINIIENHFLNSSVSM